MFFAGIIGAKNNGFGVVGVLPSKWGVVSAVAVTLQTCRGHVAALNHAKLLHFGAQACSIADLELNKGR